MKGVALGTIVQASQIAPPRDPRDIVRPKVAATILRVFKIPKVF